MKASTLAVPLSLSVTIAALIFAPVARGGPSVRKVSDAQKLPQNIDVVRVFQPHDAEGIFKELLKRPGIWRIEIVLSRSALANLDLLGKLPNLDTLSITTNCPLERLAPILGRLKRVRNLELSMR